MTLEELLTKKAQIEQKLTWTNGEQRAELQEMLSDIEKKIALLS